MGWIDKVIFDINSWHPSSHFLIFCHDYKILCVYFDDSYDQLTPEGYSYFLHLPISFQLNKNDDFFVWKYMFIVDCTVFEKGIQSSLQKYERVSSDLQEREVDSSSLH